MILNVLQGSHELSIVNRLIAYAQECDISLTAKEAEKLMRKETGTLPENREVLDEIYNLLKDVVKEVDGDYSRKAWNLYRELVPDRDKPAQTVAGELLRAFSDIDYHARTPDFWMMNGRKLGVEYSYDTVNPPVRFIAETIGPSLDLDIVLFGMAGYSLFSCNDDRMYHNCLNCMAKILLDFLDTHPELRETVNTVDSLHDYCRETDKTWDLQIYNMDEVRIDREEYEQAEQATDEEDDSREFGEQLDCIDFTYHKVKDVMTWEGFGYTWSKKKGMWLKDMKGEDGEIHLYDFNPLIGDYGEWVMIPDDEC